MSDFAEIIFYPENQAYFTAGQVVTGFFRLRLSNLLPAQSIQLFVHGECETSWTTQAVTEPCMRCGQNMLDMGYQNPSRPARPRSGRGHPCICDPNDKSQPYTIFYRGAEIFGSQQLTLWGMSGNAMGSSTMMSPNMAQIPPGEHQFPFQFQIQATGLPTFEGAHGKVHYACHVIVNQSTKWFNFCTTTRPFTVKSKVNLNQIPGAGDAINVSDSKSLWYIVIPSGTMSATLRLPKSGYVPGEQLRLKIEVKNDSSRFVNKVEFWLVQMVKYLALPVKWDREMHCCCKRIEPQKNEVSKSEEIKTKLYVFSDPFQGNKVIEIPSLKVPSSVISGFSSRFIESTFRLKVVVVPSGPSYSLELGHPLIIGDIPVQQEDIMVGLYPTLGASASGPVKPSAPQPPLKLLDGYVSDDWDYEMP